MESNMDFLRETVSISFLDREVNERKRIISKLSDRIRDIDSFITKCTYNPKPNATNMMHMLMESRMLDKRIDHLYEEIGSIREKIKRIEEEENSADEDSEEDNSCESSKEEEADNNTEKVDEDDTQKYTPSNDDEYTFEDLGPEPDIEDLLPELGGSDF